MQQKPNDDSQASHWMPTGEEARVVLKQRADVLRSQPIKQTEERVSHFIRICLSETDCYGIPYEYASEVMSMPILTRVPRSPDYIVGVMNWRGGLISILNLALLFQLRSQAAEQKGIVVVQSQHRVAGIVIPHLASSESYEAHQLTPAMTTAGAINPDYLLGLYQGRVAIINIPSILESMKLA